MGIKIRDFFTIAKNAKLSTNRVITLENSRVENRQFLVCCEHAPFEWQDYNAWRLFRKAYDTYFWLSTDFFSNRVKTSRVYPLKFGSQGIPVYCHMGDFGCGHGGWTLAMKIDGTKVQVFQLIT